ncbi:hypothetical protein FHS96_000370 [Sphingomonas zeicaulis]|uniref:hypothetical protein n=1 Tax=Sphingomonas zeicaulis TaxID=1632740 RepID=UPI003D1CC852
MSIVGGAALIWYALGALTMQLAQLGMLPHLSPDEIAYHITKSAWIVAMTVLIALVMLPDVRAMQRRGMLR